MCTIFVIARVVLLVVNIALRISTENSMDIIPYVGTALVVLLAFGIWSAVIVRGIDVSTYDSVFIIVMLIQLFSMLVIVMNKNCKDYFKEMKHVNQLIAKQDY